MAQLNKRGLRTAKTANDFYQFTSVINRELEYHEKIRIIEYMWQFAYADGTVSAHKNHLLRKISELLYIPHGDYIAAKILGFPMMYKLSFREIGKLCGNAEQVPARSRSCFNESGLLNKKSFFICNHAFHRHSGGGSPCACQGRTPIPTTQEHPWICQGALPWITQECQSRLLPCWR